MGEDPMYLLARPSAGEEDDSTGETAADLVCPICPLYATKPENTPLHIAAARYFAMEHEEEVANGLRLKDKDDLTPLQWAAVRGLSRGRSRFEEWQIAERKKEDNLPKPIK